jgi:hypothetical protein
VKPSDSRTPPFEPGLLIERLELSHQRSRNVDNWPFAFSIIDGEVVKNVHRFNKKAFIAAQEEALL